MTDVLPIIVINLDRVPERMDFVNAQFGGARLGAAVTRFSAIDGRAGDFAPTGYAPHQWRDRWELERSEQAVFESHRAVWDLIANDHARGAIICEDDVLVSQGFGAVFDHLDLTRFGVVKLDGFSAARRYGAVHWMGGMTVRPILEAVPSAACYAISQATARQLVAQSASYCATLDDYLFTPRSGITPVQLFPALAVQAMCCVATEDTAVPDPVGQSERAAPQTNPRQASKGPLLFRLLKEMRRAITKTRARLGGDAALITSGGVIMQPDLALDLPPYRTG